MTPHTGTRGPCAICQNFSHLSENHVPPRAAGNYGNWHVRSYLTSASAQKDEYFPRHFRDGIAFRTLCQDCNNGLGGKEDKALSQLYQDVHRWVASPLLLAPRIEITTKPNLIYRSVVAHLASCNDSGSATAFDVRAREILKLKQIKKSEVPNLYFWAYSGPDLLILRDMMVFNFLIPGSHHFMQVLKLAPLGFMITDYEYPNLRNLRACIQPHDDFDAIIGLQIRPADSNPFWPAVVEGYQVLLAGATLQLHATRPRNWRGSKFPS